MPRNHLIKLFLFEIEVNVKFCPCLYSKVRCQLLVVNLIHMTRICLLLVYVLSKRALAFVLLNHPFWSAENAFPSKQYGSYQTDMLQSQWLTVFVI